MKAVSLFTKFILFLFFLSLTLCAETYEETSDFPSASTNPPVTLSPGDNVNASINPNGDRDMIKINVPANTNFPLSIQSTTEDFGVWGALYIYDNGWIYQESYVYDVTGYNPRSISLNGGTSGRTYYLYVFKYSESDKSIGSYTVTYATKPAINTRIFTKVPVKDVDDLNIFGSALMIGNQLICLNDADGDTCRAPDIGATNNSINQHKVKIDPNGPSNNSMAKLVLETGDQIVWAGLYWSARIGSQYVEHPEADSIYMRTPNSSSYTKVTSNPNKFNWYSDGAVFDYACMQDVTSDVKNAGGGEYYVGGIQASNGQNSFAAWVLIVIVENNSRDFKNISVYDGFQAVFDDSTDYPSSVDVQASGFLTPKTGDVTSSLFVFTGESESGIFDAATITDKDGIAHTLTDVYNDADDLFNGSASILGEHRSNHPDPNIANPNFQNLAGTDIDIIEVTQLSNFQTNTTITIESRGEENSDRYTLNMFALETELYTPRFCYDYAYEQDGVDFTEENDGTKNPFIVGGGLSTSSPVDVKIYLKNLVDSDITITDLKLNILNIDTTQVTYKPSSVYLTPIGGLFPYHVSDSLLDTTNATQVLHIPVGDMNSNDHLYLYYSLNPQKSTLNAPLLIEASYTLTIGGESIPYATRIGERIEMCSDSNFKYVPIKGIFSVVDNNYYDYDLGGSSQFYNLPTQVVNKAGNFKLVSFDENNLDEPKQISTRVAVELLDASGFHDIQHTCTEQNASVSGLQWIAFDDQASVNFLALFPIASKNATFRISYNNMSDQGDDIVQTERLSNGNYKMLNFPYLAGEPCTRPTLYPLGSSGNFGTATQVSQACGNAGNQGITQQQLDACMECIYGKNTTFICSRDNFSIRPEAFNIQLRDTGQVLNATNGTNIPNVNADLASGYNYDVLIDAVTHTNDNPSVGYNSEFSQTTTILDTNGNPVIRQARATDPNFYGFAWTPGAQNVSGCNDIQDQSLTVKFNNGRTNHFARLDEIGIYTYLLQDSQWTRVDQLPSHHSGVNFTGDFDCLGNQSLVQSWTPNIIDMAPNNYQNFLNGCMISSNHTNVDRNVVYNNYLIEFHPYNFNVTGITPTVGLNNLPLNNNTGFIYMADVNDDNITVTGQLFRDMSLQLNGPIIAEGANNVALSNFVDNCFAQPLDVDLTDMVYAPVVDANGDPINYQFRLLTEDDQAVQVRDTGAIIYDPTLAYTSGMPNIPTLATIDFAQTAQGQTDTTLLLNFDRAVNIAANPQQITFNNYNVGCTTPADCTFIADMNPNATATGTQNINAAITHYYARSFTPRQSYTDSTGIAPIFYEVYCDVNSGCDTTLLQSTNVSQGGDSRWRINTNHTANYGLVTNINQKNAANVAASDITLNSSTLTYNNNRRPYTATMQHQPNTWLVYNPYDATATTNEFEAEFIGGASDWAGQTKTDDTTQTDGSQRTNRRLVW